MEKEYQSRCKERATKKSASCENKEESFSGEVAAKELFPSEAGDGDDEEPGNRLAPESVAANEQLSSEEGGRNDEAPGDREDRAEENLTVVEEADPVPKEEDKENQVAGSNENDFPAEEDEVEDDADEDLRVYSSARIDGQWKTVQGVMVEEVPERFSRHEGKQVLLPEGALGGMPEEMVEVRDVYCVVNAEEAEAKEHQAECVWVYDIRRTKDNRGMLAACVDMLQFLVPKGLLAQEIKMATALRNARGMNFALGNRLLKHEHWDVLGSWWFEKG